MLGWRSLDAMPVLRHGGALDRLPGSQRGMSAAVTAPVEPVASAQYKASVCSGPRAVIRSSRVPTMNRHCPSRRSKIIRITAPPALREVQPRASLPKAAGQRKGEGRALFRLHQLTANAAVPDTWFDAVATDYAARYRNDAIFLVNLASKQSATVFFRHNSTVAPRC